MEPMTKDETMRLTALDRAISAGTGTVYTDFGSPQTSADLLLEAAKKFEAYLKGENNG